MLQCSCWHFFRYQVGIVLSVQTKEENQTTRVATRKTPTSDLFPEASHPVSSSYGASCGLDAQNQVQNGGLCWTNDGVMPVADQCTR
jgi:hypothetical protein